MKNYLEKIAIYKNPETNYKWLTKIRGQGFKRCKKDLFKHLYLSGESIKLKENSPEGFPILDIRTNTINIRLKNLEFIENKNLEKLFE